MRTVRFFFAMLVLLLNGCGNSESATPKTELSEKDKQQIRELNEQRASEWGTTKRKK